MNNAAVPVFDAVNRQSRQQQLPVFLCPSDPYSEDAFVVRDDIVTPIGRYVAASYAANWGPLPPAIKGCRLAVSDRAQRGPQRAAHPPDAPIAG